MKKTDPVGIMAVLLLAAVNGRDQASIEQAAAYCVELNISGHETADTSVAVRGVADVERAELLAAVAEAARERSRQGESGIGVAEWSLLAHLAS